MHVLARAVVSPVLKTLRTTYHRLGGPSLIGDEPLPEFDLHGEKFLDWAWVVGNLPRIPSRCIDIGCAESPLVPIMLALGHEVVGVDLGRVLYDLPGFTFYQGDFNHIPLQLGSFDVAVMCSAVEHIGLSGRYDSLEDPEGDVKAMRKVSTLLRPGGVLILTIPVGVDGVHSPWHRVYGQKQLPILLDGYRIVKSRFFVKRPRAEWYEVDASYATRFPATVVRYALGEYVLARTVAGI